MGRVTRKRPRGDDNTAASPTPATRGFWTPAHESISATLPLPVLGQVTGAWPTKRTIDSESILVHRNHRRRYDPVDFASIQLDASSKLTGGFLKAARLVRTKKDNHVLVRAVRIPLAVSPDLLSVFEKLSHAFRWAYNECVTEYNRRKEAGDTLMWKGAYLHSLRKTVMDRALKIPWTSKYPRQVLRTGCEAFLKAVKSSWGKFFLSVADRIPTDEPTFFPRAKKDWSARWHFTADANACRRQSNGTICIFQSVLLKRWGVDSTLAIQDRYAKYFAADNRCCCSDFMICQELSGRVVMIVTEYLSSPKEDAQAVDAVDAVDAAIVALDPGKRTFMYAYSPTAGCGEVDLHLNSKLIARRAKLAQVSRGLSVVSSARLRRRMLFRRRRVEASIADLVDDAHWKLAHWLCRRFDTIVLGNFSIPDIVKGGIAAETKWVLLRQRHCMFRQRLQFVASQYPGVTVRMQNEAYTSKTCTNCGVLNEKLGSSKVFNCAACRHVLDRDANGARNILLRHLHDQECANVEVLLH